MKRVDPLVLFSAAPRFQAGEAVLCWGKAARRTWDAICRRVSGPTLLIGPEDGEHPIPGEGSFAAGEAILEFFDALRRERVRRLRIFLSGGASSLAWIVPAGISVPQLRAELERLYRLPLTIAELNERRTRLCALKGGGAAAWLGKLAPRTRAQVEVISDVAPFGPDVVGSGPFWNGTVPHHVVADNASLLRAIETAARSKNLKVLARFPARARDVQEWVEILEACARVAVRRNERGILVMGGEPRFRIPESGAGRGGRQTHLAALLASRLSGEIRKGRVEILCAASDGVDGRSGAAGAFIDAAVLRDLPAASLRAAIRSFDTSRALGRAGALLPARDSGTNVQDAAILLLK